MLTSVQIFRYDRKLTACALGEPSVTLVRNDSEFGLLLAGGAHEDSFLSRLYLEDVTYLRVSGRDWCYTEFDSVAVFPQEDVWVAQDTATGHYFPYPSQRPYHVVFISRSEFQRLQGARSDGFAFPVFEAAQKHFGRLPGFSYRDSCLITPHDYANCIDGVPISEYVVTRPRS